MNDKVPTFGSWCELLQELPFTNCNRSFHAECMEEIERGRRTA